MKIQRLCVPLFLVFSLAFLQAQAQIQTDTTQLWQIELQNENTYIGKIISRDSETIVFDSQELGIINIQVQNIKSMKAIKASQIREGAYWAENPQSTRYFWSPTGYGLRKGDGYYQNVWIFFNQFSVGISDNTSIGVGFMPLFLFAGASTPVWITPKVSVPVSEKFNVGAGALLGGILGEDTDGPFGIAYGTATLGTRDQNLTLGLGYGFAGGEWANVPTINISGMIRTGKKGYFLTENYLIDTGDDLLVLLLVGGRVVWPKIALDYGALLPLGADIDSFVAIPWLGISIPFGKKTPSVQE
jgi:hypothetical protein